MHFVTLWLTGNNMADIFYTWLLKRNRFKIASLCHVQVSLVTWWSLGEICIPKQANTRACYVTLCDKLSRVWTQKVSHLQISYNRLQCKSAYLYISVNDLIKHVCPTCQVFWYKCDVLEATNNDKLHIKIPRTKGSRDCSHNHYNA